MYLTGFADEAADDLSRQIRATKALGWENIEARSVGGENIHDISDERFEDVYRELCEAGVNVNCFGSTIANWGRSVEEPFEETLAAVDRAVRRMKRCGTRLIRIMSYSVLRGKDGKALNDQKEKERFRRLREITDRFTGEGLIPVHENCFTYGGMSAAHAHRLLENVPGLKLVFDTGNPPLTPDFSKPFPYPMQDSWEFYASVKAHIAYVHIKDSVLRPGEGSGGEEIYTYPGEGAGHVAKIVKDLLASGYDGGFSMEPHMAVVFHDASVKSSADARFQNYLEYGRRFMRLLEA
ncbi:MAG: sugar phosphate isomerase/epimerase [Spirochaetales bacterium]|jgi:sugar phosphate isomerase/epimerase|nr:sugar phosphate isomerase/epimerase [Spirochaetales bacterium]